MSQEYTLKIEGLNKSFHKQNKKGIFENNHIIQDLSMVVPQGKITALIGGNAAGKTTLFNCISRLIDIDSGSMEYQYKGNKYQLETMKAFEIPRIGVGRLFQHSMLFQEMSVLDNMLIADSIHKMEIPFMSLINPKKTRKNEDKQIVKVQYIFNKFLGKGNDFWKKRDQKAKTLSLGQQRILGLLRLMMSKEYDLLLLDEPTSGVNQMVYHTAGDIITQMASELGKTVLMIEHNMQFVLKRADFCSFMSEGKVTAFGSPEDIIGDDTVRKTYMGI